MTMIADLATLLTLFFTQYLMQQRHVSPHTIASYRDTFRLLTAYAHKSLGKAPQELSVADISADLVSGFLTDLENGRGNGPRTRNSRLAAIRSFFRLVAVHEPKHAALAQRVLAIPTKRLTRRIVDFLDQDEVNALVQAPDQTRWVGRRDHTVLVLAVQTGMRASEIITLRRDDIHLGRGAHLRCHGKGRKGALHSSAPGLDPGPRRVAEGRCRRPGRSGLPEPARPTAPAREPRVPPRQECEDCADWLPIPRQKTDHSPYPEAHRCHGPAAEWHRHHRHSPVAWT